MRTTNSIQGRDNMIKRFNKFIISKILGIRPRPVGAAFLGGCAGLSLTTTILPEVISALGIADSFSARIDLAGFAVYAVMLWAVGGWAAQKTASSLGGAAVLGLVGAISAAIFAGMTYGADMTMILFDGAAGLAYGAVGGLLIASALADNRGAAG